MLYAYINAGGIQYLFNEVDRCIQPDVLEVPVIKKALEDVEEIYKTEGLAMYSRRHGVKSPQSLSNGIKALMLLYYQSKGECTELISSGCFGDNVGKYVQEMSLTMDIHISWDSYLPMCRDAPILAKDMSTGEVITDVERFQKVVGRKGGEPSVPATEFKGF